MQYSIVSAADDAGIAIITRPGAPAPFSGILFSEKVFAEKQAKDEADKERVEQRHKFELEMQKNRLMFATSTTAIALDAETKKNKALLEMKDERIQMLQTDLVKAQESSRGISSENILWMLGGAGAVLLGAVATSLVASSISK